MRASLSVLAVSGLFAGAALAVPTPASADDAFPHAGFIGNTHGNAKVPTVNKPTGTAAAIVAAEEASSTGSIVAHATGGAEYVVLFNSSAPVPAEVEAVLTKLDLSSNHSDVKYTFDNGAFKGFVANMKSHCLETLANMTDEISFVEESVAISSLATRTQATWGLQRISSSGAIGSTDDKSLTFTYTFEEDAAALGAGVDIYVVDTGVNVNHAVFGGRAVQGFSFETDNTDGDGHGTHVAGTAAGAIFGVASAANIFAVKVLGADGSGLTSDTIAGMDWVVQHNAQRKTQAGYVGAVMSMSWGLSGTSDSITTAIQAASAAGIHVSVAAGNSAENSCSSSPSNTGGTGGNTVTVGSIGIDDAISSFSNSGACNDVYAPGENVLSAWNTANNTINFLSGTSMACPHVTGVMAYLMTQNATLASSPAAMKAFLRSSGLKNLATGTTNTGDPKIVVNNGVTATLSKRSNGLGYTIVEKREGGEPTTMLKRGEMEFELVNRGESTLRY